MIFDWDDPVEFVALGSVLNWEAIFALAIIGASVSNVFSTDTRDAYATAGASANITDMSASYSGAGAGAYTTDDHTEVSN